MDLKAYCYQFTCSNGVVVSLMPEPEGKYRIMYGETYLGTCNSIDVAVDALVKGEAVLPSDGTELSKLGISGDLSDWDKIAFAEVKGVTPT